MRTFWLVGEYTGDPDTTFDFIGIFDTEEKAVAAFVNEKCFYFKVEMTAPVPAQDRDEYVYPLIEDPQIEFTPVVDKPISDVSKVD